jgi:hypothetical protein
MKKFVVLAGLAILVAAPAAAYGDGAPAALPAPAPGKGQVVIFRPSSMGFAVKCTVRENGAMVGRVGPGKYYVIEAEPGTHSYTAKTEASDMVTVQVEPDETSYVKCGISMGVMVGRPNLSPATEEEFLKSAGKIKPMDSAKIAAEIEKDRTALAGKAKAGGAN